jgi:hypothetical protein
MGVKLPGPFPVEIFGQGERWQAREIATAKRNLYEKLGRFGSLSHAKAEVSDAFEKQIEPWQLWGTMPANGNAAVTEERMLTPYDFIDLGNGKFGMLQDEDRTHIIHAQSIPPGARIPPAACGAQVNAKCFISTKANVEPSCRGCAEVWRKEYRDK